jgi:hypothetical protein
MDKKGYSRMCGMGRIRRIDTLVKFNPELMSICDMFINFFLLGRYNPGHILLYF